MCNVLYQTGAHGIMQRKPRILVVGSFVMDVIATTERVPPSGQTVYGKEFHMAPAAKVLIKRCSVHVWALMLP